MTRDLICEFDWKCSRNRENNYAHINHKSVEKWRKSLIQRLFSYEGHVFSAQFIRFKNLAGNLARTVSLPERSILATRLLKANATQIYTPLTLIFFNYTCKIRDSWNGLKKGHVIRDSKKNELVIIRERELPRTTNPHTSLILVTCSRSFSRSFGSTESSSSLAVVESVPKSANDN